MKDFAGEEIQSTDTNNTRLEIKNLFVCWMQVLTSNIVLSILALKYKGWL